MQEPRCTTVLVGSSQSTVGSCAAGRAPLRRPWPRPSTPSGQLHPCGVMALDKWMKAWFRLMSFGWTKRALYGLSGGITQGGPFLGWSIQAPSVWVCGWPPVGVWLFMPLAQWAQVGAGLLANVSGAKTQVSTCHIGSGLWFLAITLYFGQILHIVVLYFLRVFPQCTVFGCCKDTTVMMWVQLDQAPSVCWLL